MNLKQIFENFNAYDNKTALNIIKKNNENSLDVNDKNLIIVAGPNGSGKTTLVANLYNSRALSYPYLNADLFASTLLSFIADDLERNKSSMYYTMDKVAKYINIGKSFCYETVLSHPSKIELIKLAKEKGYKITSIFVYTNSPSINIERVKARAEQGGHDVPIDKIQSRYYRSIELSKELKLLSDKYYSFDNSKTLTIKNLEIEK